MSMNIGVIGAGSLGKTVARQAAMANDLVVVALPLGAVVSLPSDLFGATPAASVIVDAGNYFPITRDGVIPEIEAGMLDSEWVAMRIGRPVIKAFNMIHAHSLASGGSEAGTQGRMAIAIAGDDLLAKARVAALIDQIGFDTVDTGSLSESWRQQPGTLAFCHDYDAWRLQAAIAVADSTRIAQYRQESDAFGSALSQLLGGNAAVGAA
jgi:8-hydroxy-5-deazaflavin:NADPH oxidoreductase